MIPIEQITLTHIAMPLVTPFETSFGRDEDGARPSCSSCARVGPVAGARRSPSPTRRTRRRRSNTCWSILMRYLIPAVFARPLSDLAELHSRWAWMRHEMARAAIEGRGRRAAGAEAAGQSLSAYLGGTRDRVPVGV